MEHCIVYIGDFDLRNENVQAHLVRNNGKIFNALGYHVEYIGINRKETSFRSVSSLPNFELDDGNCYFELPDTLSMAGLFQVPAICTSIIDRLNEIKKTYHVDAVISYQSPTYATALKKIVAWCRRNKTQYLVNCADLPIFDLQSPIRKMVMKANWDYMHQLNQKNADGIIAVSKYIANFYCKEGRPSVVIPPLFDVSTASLSSEANEVPTFVYAGTPFKLTGHEASPDGMKDRLDKIIDLFLELTKQKVKYVFYIVGITQEEYALGVPRHAKALEEESSISFWGKCDHKDTLQRIITADFSVNYRDENLMTKAGFSTKIVESVSLGTPVIINSISDTFLYLQDGCDAFMLSGDIKRDAEKLKMLCSLSPEKRQKMKHDLYDKRIFDFTRYVGKMKSFFDSLESVEG